MINWLEKRKHFAIILTLLIAAEIFYFSSISGVNLGTGGMDLSTAYHMIVFFLFNFFLLISISGSKEMRIKSLIIALAVSLAYAIFDEIHQIFVPFRYPDVSDILIDTMGILLATFVYIYYKNKSRRIL